MAGLVRSVLFVPGNRPRMLEKGPSSGADALILDLEDSVPLSEKEAARKMVREMLENASFAKPALFVRINSLSTGLAEADVDAVLCSRLEGVCLPKCESAADVRWLAGLITRLEKERGLTEGQVQIHAAVETAKGVLRGEEVASADPRVASLTLGGEDFATDMGVARTREGVELLHARAWLALCARSAEVQPIDAVFADFSDEEGLRQEIRSARQLGYTGKTLIHPSQVGPVNEMFSPSEAEIAHARRIVEVFDSSVAQGLASVAVDGKMVDIPVYKRAKNLLALVERQNS